MTKEDKRIYTMSKEKPSTAVLKMGMPLVCGMFIMVLYNLVDTYFIGLTRDNYQLAAVNLAYPVMMVMIAIANMIGTGSSSYIARCLGAGEHEKAEKTLTMGFLLSVINSLLVSVIGFAGMSFIIRLLGAKENTYAYTEQYVTVLLIGSIFTMGSYTMGAFLRGEGSVKYSMVGMLVGTVANIILDPFFIFVLDMQIKGAAIATVIGNAFGTIVSLIFYISGKTLLKPSLKYLKPDISIIGEIYFVGLPASLETLLTSAAYVVNNNLAVRYGELMVAATGISQKVLSLGTYIYQGMASGVQPIMGYNYGASDYRRMRDILKSGVLIVTGIELIIMCMYGLLAPVFIAVFTKSPEVINIGAGVLRRQMFILPFVGTVSMCRMSFQAMGKPFHAFAITLVRQLILYIPMLLLFNSLFGFWGMLWAQPFTELSMMVVSLAFIVEIIKGEEKKKSTQ